MVSSRGLQANDNISTCQGGDVHCTVLFGQIQFAFQTNTVCNSDKYSFQFRQIQFAIQTKTYWDRLHCVTCVTLCYNLLHSGTLWYTALAWSLAFAWGVGSILGGTVISEWHPTDSRASNNPQISNVNRTCKKSPEKHLQKYFAPNIRNPFQQISVGRTDTKLMSTDARQERKH